MLTSRPEKLLCPQTIAEEKPEKCYGTGCMAFRQFDEHRGYCGLAGPIGQRDVADNHRILALEREHKAMKTQRGKSRHE